MKLLFNNMIVGKLFLVAVYLSHTVCGDVMVEGLKNVEVREGEEFTLLCTIQDVSIRFCTFTKPEGEQLFMDKEAAYENKRITFHGSDPTRDCGIKVSQVEAKDHGEWKCEVATLVEGNIKKGNGVAMVTVLKAPTSVYLEPSGASPLVAVYPQDAEKLISCYADGGRPEPTFSWKVGEQPVQLEIVETEVIESYDDGATKVKQTVKYVPKPEHNGKKLSCVVNSNAYHQADLDEKVNVDSINLDIQFRPAATNENEQVFYGMQTGEEFQIMIAFKSHPKPDEITWNMYDGEVISEDVESANGRYLSERLQEGPMKSDGTYTAVLTIKNVQEQDEDSVNTLVIRNSLGETEIRFRLGMGEKPAADSDGNTQVEGLANSEAGVGPIVAIVVIVLLVLLALAVAVVARVKGLLCWAAKDGDVDEEKGQLHQANDSEQEKVKEVKTNTAPAPTPAAPEQPAAKEPGTVEEKQALTSETGDGDAEKKSNGAHSPM